MRQLYTPVGIDVQKTVEDAVNNGPAIVHFHSAASKCRGYKHEMYEGGKRVDKWGGEDGSSNPSNLQGQ